MKYNFEEFFERYVKKFNYSVISERLTATISGDLHALFISPNFYRKENVWG
jgi:hypothetical protein